jgi:hypothetical protein
MVCVVLDYTIIVSVITNTIKKHYYCFIVVQVSTFNIILVCFILVKTKHNTKDNVINFQTSKQSYLSLIDKLRLKSFFNSYKQQIDELKSINEQLLDENNQLKNIPKDVEPKTSSLFDKLLVNKYVKMKNENYTLKKQLNDFNLPMMIVESPILVPPKPLVPCGQNAPHSGTAHLDRHRAHFHRLYIDTWWWT